MLMKDVEGYRYFQLKRAVLKKENFAGFISSARLKYKKEYDKHKKIYAVSDDKILEAKKLIRESLDAKEKLAKKRGYMPYGCVFSCGTHPVGVE